MAAYFSEDKITEIKNQVDILDIVSESVLMKKAGRNYVGLCPFHSEKTPSFSVSPDKQIFYCFGCGEGGNVFSFLMKMEGLSFPETARQLARRYGIDIPSRSLTPAQKQRMSQKERMLAINRIAAEFYQGYLFKNKAGGLARDYFVKRGITKETCQGFGLGYAPEGWEHLSRFLMMKRIPLEPAEQTGLLIAGKQKKGFYDRFRNRIIFPIHDAGGQVIGFGGRVMDDALPKYLNSPESPVYNKSNSLYGLHRARRACREADSVYIVEGYFDLIRLHQSNIKNAVATLGTALTEAHIRILKGYARKAVLVFDSDTAGIRAAHRSIDLFMKADMDAKVMVLPQGHDPDTFLAEYGYDEFMRYTDNASGMMRFLISAAIEEHGLSIEGKIRILKQMQQPLTAIGDHVARSLYVKELAERIGVDEAAVIEKIRIQALEGDGRRPAFPRQIGDSKGSNGGLLQTKGVRLERQIVVMMLQFPEIIPEIDRSGLIEFFENVTLKSICKTIFRHQAQSVSEIINAMEDKAEQSLAAGLAMGENIWDRDGCLKLISQFETSQSRKGDDLLKQIKSAEDNKDHVLLLELLKKRQMQVTQSH